LLLPADDAQLLRRVQAAVAMQARLYALALEKLLQPLARLVAPHHREKANARVQLLAVPRDVGRATQALVLVIDEDYRHGRLGRDPGDFAEPVPVEHHVAYDQHPRLRRVGGFQDFLRMAKYSRPCARTAAGP